MPFRHVTQPDKSTTTLHSQMPQPRPTQLQSPLQPAALVQRALSLPAALTPAEVLLLHRSIGNRAVCQLVQGYLPRQASGAPPSHTRKTAQPKLNVGAVGDPYEREADRVAQQVVQQRDTAAQPPVGQAVQRHAYGDEAPLRLPPASIQPQAGERGLAVSPDLETAIQQARGGGQPLPEALRGLMEQALGADFHGVRLHTDAHADALNRSLQAQAFTTGQDIFFGQGAYHPYRSSGHELLAHELTHVMQQDGTAKGTRIQRNGGKEGAGTKPRSFTQGKEYLVKYTSAREKYVYEHKDALGLGDILPEYHAVKPADPNSATITSVQTDEGKIYKLEDSLKREDDKDLIMVRTVGYVPAATQGKPHKIVMDIKIGSYTKSQMQFEQEGAGWLLRGAKDLEHGLKDWWKGNREVGFSILSGKEDYEKACWWATNGIDRDALRAATQKIISDLSHIKGIMAQAVENITFVGSSMLCVLNLTNPQRSEAKMIDPDHPIVTARGDRGEHVPEDVLTPERIDLRHRAKLATEAMDQRLNQSRDFDTSWLGSNQDDEERQAQVKGLTAQFLSKYKANYTDGLQQLITFFQEKKTDLDKQVATPRAEVSDPLVLERNLFFGW
jgi:Domain of unknown function (DUF4157)